jgi:adenylate kinase family enzyme
MITIFCFIGPPGSGKGTNSSHFYNKHKHSTDIVRFSVGDELRALDKSDSSGSLADPDVVESIINKFLSKNNDFYIIDGYPRSIEQAQKLFARKGNTIIFISLYTKNTDVLVDRLTNRHTCGDCGHVSSNNKICPCGSMMTKRQDDSNNEAILKRIEIYNHSRDDIMSLCNANKIEFCEFDCLLDIDTVSKQVEELMLQKMNIKKI